MKRQIADMSDKQFSFSDVSEHSSKKDLYIVVHDKVYNCSSFVDEHPYVAHRSCPFKQFIMRKAIGHDTATQCLPTIPRPAHVFQAANK